MSIHYLLTAVRDTIRSGLSYRDEECDVTAPPGEPPPRMGKYYAAVHQGPYHDQGGGMSLNQLFGCTVTLTVRINEPFDRLGPDNLQKLTQGVNDRAAAIAVLVHGSYSLMNSCNSAIWAATALSVGGFIEPLWSEGVDIPRIVHSDWFHSAGGGEVGFACDIRFGRARRVQSLGLAT